MISVSDQQEGLHQANLRGSRALEDYRANLEAQPNFSGTQSILEYEYVTGVHMFVSYNKFSPNGNMPLLVTTAPVPRISGYVGEKNDVLVQVEVRINFCAKSPHLS